MARMSRSPNPGRLRRPRARRRHRMAWDGAAADVAVVDGVVDAVVAVADRPEPVGLRILRIRMSQGRIEMRTDTRKGEMRR